MSLINLPPDAMASVLSFLTKEKTVLTTSFVPDLKSIQMLSHTSTRVRRVTYDALVRESRTFCYLLDHLFTQRNFQAVGSIVKNLPAPPYHQLRPLFDYQNEGEEYKRAMSSVLDLGGKAQLTIGIGTDLTEADVRSLGLERFVYLDLKGLEKLPCQFFHSVQLHQNLEIIDLSFTQIDLEGLRAVVRNRPRLTGLIIRRCPNLSEGDLLQLSFPNSLSVIEYGDRMDFSSISSDALLESSNGLSQAILAMRVVLDDPEKALDCVQQGRKILEHLSHFSFVDKILSGYNPTDREEKIRYLHRLKSCGSVHATAKFTLLAIENILGEGKRALDNVWLKTLETLYRDHPDHAVAAAYLGACILYLRDRHSGEGENPQSKRVPEARELLDKSEKQKFCDDVVLTARARLALNGEDSMSRNAQVAYDYAKEALRANPQNIAAMAMLLKSAASADPILELEQTYALLEKLVANPLLDKELMESMDHAMDALVRNKVFGNQMRQKIKTLLEDTLKYHYYNDIALMLYSSRLFSYLRV